MLEATTYPRIHGQQQLGKCLCVMAYRLFQNYETLILHCKGQSTAITIIVLKSTTLKSTALKSTALKSTALKYTALVLSYSAATPIFTLTRFGRTHLQFDRQKNEVSSIVHAHIKNFVRVRNLECESTAMDDFMRSVKPSPDHRCTLC